MLKLYSYSVNSEEIHITNDLCNYVVKVMLLLLCPVDEMMCTMYWSI